MDDCRSTPTPKLVDIKQVSSGWINKYLLTYSLPDGTVFSYESISRRDLKTYSEALNHEKTSQNTPDAVCIVPQTADGSLVMIREFRYPLNAWCIAFPAGLVEEGEDLPSAIDRELREETGYALLRDEHGEIRHDALSPLPQAGFSSTGLTDETVHIVFAKVESTSAAQPEATEFIEVFLLKPEDAKNFLQNNTEAIGTRAQLILELFAQLKGAHTI